MKNVLSQSKDMTREYCATVVQIGELKPIENSDFLATVMVEGLEIVVRKDLVKTGSYMIYVANECQIDPQFLSVNNQYSDITYNLNYQDVYPHLEKMRKQNATEEEIQAYLIANKGYFGKNGRVRMKKIRGVMSQGFLISPFQMGEYEEDLEGFDWAAHLGEDFDMVGERQFVKPYVPEVKGKNGGVKKGRHEKQIKKYDRMIPGQFAFHYDTEPLQRSMERIKPGTSVSITVKEHGCVDKDTIVNTDHGDFTIKEIVDNKLPYKIKAFDIENNKEVYVDIDQYYMIPNDGEWYEIELEDGRKITITGNNPVWLPELNCYRRTDELKIGDVLLIS